MQIVTFIDISKEYKLGSIDEHHHADELSARLTEAENSEILHRLAVLP
ncbi:MAG: hypothetical protein V4634_13235 [Pseudomonadota bacterium]